MEKRITVDPIEVFYEETGNPEGPSVILMHGWGCDHSTVKSIARTIEGTHRVFNIDLPGHGKSSEPDRVWGVEDFTEWLEKLVETLQITKPSLIGHSFGGRISIIYASRNDVDRLLLVDAAGIKPKRSLNYYRKVYTFKLLKKFIKAVYGKDKGERKIESLRSKRGSSDYKNSTPIMRGIMSRCVNEDLRSYMPSIKAPTLLLWGENDTATPLGDAKIMEKLIPDSGLVSFPGCGHYSFLDNPGGFSLVLKEFFKN